MIDLSDVKSALPISSVLALLGEDFGGNFLSGGSSLAELASAPSDMINVGTAVVTDIADSITQSALGMTTDIASTGMLSVTDVANKLTDSSQAIMDLMNYAIKDLASETTQTVTTAINDMLTLPTIGDISGKMGTYTSALMPNIGGLSKQLITVKIPSIQDLLGEVTKILGEAVKFVTDKIGWVNDKVSSIMKLYQEKVQSLLNHIDQGLEWISEKIGYIEAMVISEIEKILYGRARPSVQISHILSLIEEEEASLLKQTAKLEELKPKASDPSVAKKIAKINKRISALETKIQEHDEKIEELEHYDDKDAYNTILYNKKIAELLKADQTDAVKLKIELYQAKLYAIAKKKATAESELQSLKDEISNFQASDDIYGDIAKKEQIYREIIRLEAQETAKKGIVGLITSIKQKIINNLALSLGVATAKLVAQTSEKVLKKTLDKVTLAKNEAITKAKSKIMVALLKLLTLTA